MVLVLLANKCLTSAENVNLKHKAFQSLHFFWLCQVCKGLQIQLSHKLEKDWKRASVSLLPEILGGLWIRQFARSRNSKQ